MKVYAQCGVLACRLGEALSDGNFCRIAGSTSEKLNEDYNPSPHPPGARSSGQTITNTLRAGETAKLHKHLLPDQVSILTRTASTFFSAAITPPKET